MIVSVVIPTIGRPSALSSCIASIERQTIAPHEIVVVAQGALAECRALVARTRRASMIALSTRSLCRARNEGARASQGDVVAFIDDDAELEPRYLEVAIAALSDASVGGVSGSIIGGRVRRRYSFAERALGAPDLVPVEQVEHDMDIPCLHGSNMVIRRAAMPPGGFPSWMDGPCHREDVFVSVAMRRAGWRLRGLRDARLWHRRCPIGRSIRVVARQTLEHSARLVLVEPYATRIRVMLGCIIIAARACALAARYRTDPVVEAAIGSLEGAWRAMVHLAWRRGEHVH